MAGKRPTYTWKYVPFTAAAPLEERKFRSKGTCYAGINGDREQIREGISRIVRVTVYEWDRDAGRWMTYERIDLKKEIADELAARLKAGIEQAKAGTTKDLGDFQAHAAEGGEAQTSGKAESDGS